MVCETSVVAPRPVTVLQVLATADVGGTETSILRLVRRLDVDRFRCEVSFLHGDGRLAPAFEKAGIVLHDLRGPGGAIGAFLRVARLLRRQRYDVVHLYGFQASFIGRIAARLVRPRPVVVHGVRGFVITDVIAAESRKNRVAMALERLTSRLVDVYVTNSQGAANELVRGELPRGNVMVVHGGVDIPAPVPRRVTTTGLIACVANFRPVKRQADLV